MAKIGVEEPKYNRMTGKWSYGGTVYGSLAEANAAQRVALNAMQQQNLQTEISREITGQNKPKPVSNPVKPTTPTQPVSNPVIEPEVQARTATPVTPEVTGSNIRNNVNIVKAKKINGEYFLTDANGTQYKVNQKMYETARKAIKKGGKFNVNLNLDKTPIVNGGGGNTPVNPPKPGPVKPEPVKPKVKSGGFFSKVGDLIKNNKGKTALIAVGIIGLGTAIGIALSSGDDKKVDNDSSQNSGVKVKDNENVQQTDPQNTPTVNKPDGGEEEVTKPDGNSEKPDGNVEKPAAEQELPAGTPIDINGTVYIVKKGDYLDKIAEEYLKKANGEGNYKNQDIVDLRNKIFKDNQDVIQNVNLIYPEQQLNVKM